MSVLIEAVTDSNFENSVIEAKLPVLVDFWASWCQPCKRLNPVIEAVANDFKDVIEVKKLDVEQNQLTTAKYGIRGIPASLLFKEGSLIGQKIGGNLSQEDLINFLQTSLS